MTDAFDMHDSGDPEIRSARIREEMKVRLKAVPEEDIPEQSGVVLEGGIHEGVVIVQIDEQFLEDEDDTGYREVPVEQIEIVS